MSDRLGKERTDHLLRRIRAGGEGAEQARSFLFERLYDDLRKVARGLMRQQRPDHTLRPTALVHEAYLRLVGRDHPAFENRAHFLGVAARAMRQILVDYARRQDARKRGGDLKRITLEESLHAEETPIYDILDLDTALKKLMHLDERAARVAEMRAFAGMTVIEVAQALGVSQGTVDGDWAVARLWLSRELAETRP
jgi:RNA polymerase sigma factor (TIGR02999 family)